MKHLIIILFIVAAVVPDLQSVERDELYFKVGAGAGTSLLNNLADELELQGRELPFPEYSIMVSFGKSFADNTIRAEAGFGFSLLPDIRYQNEYEDFTEDMSHYDFSLLVRRVLMPERTLFSPSIGIGFGYGRTNLIEGAGRLDSFEVLGSVQFDSHIRYNMDLFVEAFYIQGLSEKKFGAPFLESLNSDVLIGSDGEPIKDSYGYAGLRIGVTVWLELMEERY